VESGLVGLGNALQRHQALDEQWLGVLHVTVLTRRLARVGDLECG
jgi:hypothetical protein